MTPFPVPVFWSDKTAKPVGPNVLRQAPKRITLGTMNISGHRRSYESLDSTGGTARVDRGGTVVCACGWHAAVRFRAEGITQHELHKQEVASGRYGKAVAAEVERRAAAYRELLADWAKLAKCSLTADQVQGWLDDLLSGRTKVSV